MSRAGTILGVAAVGVALVMTAVAPLSPGPGPALSEATSTAPGEPGAPGREPTAYTMPIDGDVVTAFDDPAVPWGSGHRGVDIAGEGAVVAAADGVVAFAGVVVDRPVISIDHPDGIRTTYEPVAPAVAAGDRVEQGQVIGTVAADRSHCAPAACLHWGARIGDDYIDPLSLLTEAVIRLYPIEGSAADRQRVSVVGATVPAWTTSSRAVEAWTTASTAATRGGSQRRSRSPRSSRSSSRSTGSTRSPPA